MSETRQERAVRELAEAARAREELEQKLAAGRAFAADRSQPLRKRLLVRVANGLVRASLWSNDLSAAFLKPGAKPGPSFSERMFAESRASFEAAEQSRHSATAHVESPQSASRPGLAASANFAGGWLVLGTLIGANYLVFRALGSNYFEWYLERGALINLAFSFISLAVVLDAYRDLVSSNPLRYLIACVALLNHVMLAWKATMGGEDATSRTDGRRRLPVVFDTTVSLLVFVVMFAATFGWVLVVAPLQHVVYAVLGAPARNAMRNTRVSSYDPAADTTTIDAPADSPHAGFAIGYRQKPVALTAALAGAAFWVISLLR